MVRCQEVFDSRVKWAFTAASYPGWSVPNHLHEDTAHNSMACSSGITSSPHPPVPVREVQREVFVWEPMMHVVVLHCVESRRRRSPTPPYSQRRESHHGGDEGRNLVPRMTAFVDHSRGQVVYPVEPGVDWEQEADKDLVEEDDEGLNQVETVPKEEVDEGEGAMSS